MSKKIVKLAIIRKNDADPRPFGLKIPNGCNSAGEAIQRMAPLNSEKDLTDQEKLAIAAANQRLLNWQTNPGRCKYAGQLPKDNNSVECNYGSAAPGISQSGVTPSPFFSRQYTDAAYDGLYSYPMGWYGDHNISRNLYYGLYSFQSENYDEFCKFASYLEVLDSKFFDLNDDERQILVNFAKSDNILPLQKKASKLPLEEKTINILLKWKDSHGSK